MSVSDEIKQRLDIVSIVGSYTSLTRAGRNLKALCPFHQEKTPSFYVFPETQTWRCFGACATGGDVFAFVMKKEGVEFGETLRILAAKAGVPLEERRANPREEEKDARLKEVVGSAALFFHNMLLRSAEGSRARAYVEQRGISAESVRTFQLGYSPAGWQGLLDYLQARGFSPEEMLEAGVVTKRDAGPGAYDRFRGRLMFPIHDVDGTVIGFGGRALESDAPPKYLNSPQSPLFDKSRTLYGLNLAKGAIRSLRQAVIVEGYLDALMAHQCGFQNVVASMGTSVTERQVSLLSRYASSIVLALDPDTAGQTATLRSLEVAPEATGEELVAVPAWRGRVRRTQEGGRQRITALPEGSANIISHTKGEIRVLTLPEGKDPDELLKGDPGQWAQLVANSVPMIDFLFSSAQERFDLSTPKGKAEAVDVVLPFLAQIPNAVEQAHYVQRLATMVAVDEKTLRASLPGKRPGAPRPATTRAQTVAPDAPGVHQYLQQLDVLEDYCLALLFRYEDLATKAESLRPDHFLSTEARQLFELWRDGGSQALLDVSDEFLEPRLERVQEVALPALSDAMANAALAQCIHRLEERRLRELKAQQRLQLAEEEAEHGMNTLAAVAYERWRQGLGVPEAVVPEQPMAELTERELSVNRDLQDLMRKRSTEGSL